MLRIPSKLLTVGKGKTAMRKMEMGKRERTAVTVKVEKMAVGAEKTAVKRMKARTVQRP